MVRRLGVKKREVDSQYLKKQVIDCTSNAATVCFSNGTTGYHLMGIR